MMRIHKVAERLVRHFANLCNKPAGVDRSSQCINHQYAIIPHDDACITDAHIVAVRAAGLDVPIYPGRQLAQFRLPGGDLGKTRVKGRRRRWWKLRFQPRSECKARTSHHAEAKYVTSRKHAV